jgi:DNA invertase Pin-like site-specific DNA recombinase
MDSLKYGYARVSTDDRNPALQLAALKKAGCQTVFKGEGISGVTAKRPGLRRCLKKLEHGDTLIVRKLDRLGRSRRDLITMLDDLRPLAIGFCADPIVREIPFAHRGNRHGVSHGPRHVADDRRASRTGRSLISERTRAGVKEAQRRGVKFGRKVRCSRTFRIWASRSWWKNSG